MLVNKCFGFMVDIKEYIVYVQVFYFMVDGVGDDIVWGQFVVFVKVWYKVGVIWVFKVGVFVVQCFSKQEIMCLGVIQCGGVELVKFQICYLIFCLSGYCNFVFGRDVGVSGILVNFCGFVGSEYYGFCVVGFYLFFIMILDLCFDYLVCVW